MEKNEPKRIEAIMEIKRLGNKTYSIANKIDECIKIELLTRIPHYVSQLKEANKKLEELIKKI
jgi:hypothetical protein